MIEDDDVRLTYAFELLRKYAQPEQPRRSWWAWLREKFCGRRIFRRGRA